MDRGLYHSVSAMRASERKLDAITSNLSNVGTNGFKRQSTVTRAFEVPNSKSRDTRVVAQEAWDFSQGPIARTENALDLALDGDGFFGVQTADGLRYTRDGAFHLDAQGTLQTADGRPVAWEGGDAKFEPTGAAITIDGVGTVRQGDNALGRLRLFDFDDKSLLEPDGDGRWIAPESITSRSAAAVVHQGALERSNVQAMDELVAMIRAQRGFENATNVMRTIEQSYKRLNTQR